MARKMFGGDQHPMVAVGMRAFDVSRNMPRNLFGIFAERSNVDHRIFGIVVDVGHRRENPLDPQRARFTRGFEPLITRRLDVTGRADTPC